MNYMSRLFLAFADSVCDKIEQFGVLLLINHLNEKRFEFH